MIVAEALLMAGDAKTPAKNLHTINDAAFCDRPAPNMKRAKTGVVVKKTTLRPKVSLKGLPAKGPKAIPMLYSESGRMATSSETPNSFDTTS
jgi:hypothetical protein